MSMSPNSSSMLVSIPYLTDLYEQYEYAMVHKRDIRSDDFPMMTSIWPTAFICLFYVIFVKYLGPRLMQDRKPMAIRKLMMAYNLFQTMFSLWGFSEGCRFYIFGDYSWTCQPIDYSYSPEGLRALNLAWWFYISKFFDMADSVFFVLNKKFSHLSFLHVFHHGIMPLETWFGPRFVGGGHSGFAAFFNAGVHTVMYLYYLLAAIGPSVQKYLWWKRYLTTLQMVQFVCVFLHALLPLYFECNYPSVIPKLLIVNALVFFTLFANFYISAYIHKRNKNAEMLKKSE